MPSGNGREERDVLETVASFLIRTQFLGGEFWLFIMKILDT